MAFLLTNLKDKYVALRGFHTNRHLIVIESDDWGSIRMPSYDTFVKLQRLGDHPEQDAFLSNDCLESEYDLKKLYQVLGSVHDKNGRPAVITANFAMANPDFDEIDIESENYKYESILDTYKRYYPENDVFEYVKKGLSKGVFFPQLHCREHLNVNRWMKDLKDKKKDALMAFENKMIGINASFSEDNVYGYMDAFNTVWSSDRELGKVVADAVEMFNKLFGFRSETFVASCFVWNSKLEAELARLGVKGIQSSPWQYEPVGTNGKYSLKRRIHFTGERNLYSQIYTVRNCGYEPAYYQNPDECSRKCIMEVEKSFQQRKPAIITSHRFNFIHEIQHENAERNLEGLRSILLTVKERYPDVEFITSPELVKIMERN